jgi:FkbH-like protein
MSLADRRLAWRQILRSQQPADLRLAVLSTFTAEPLVPYLGVALSQAGLTPDVYVGPYGQIIQECVNPSSETAAHRPDYVIVWPRLEELWAGKPLPLSDAIDAYMQDLDEVAVSAQAIRAWGATLIFVLPAVVEVRPLGVGDAANERGVFAAATAAREAARARLAGKAGVLVADAEEVVRSLGSTNALDWRRAALARIPYQEATFAVIGERIARLIHLSRHGAKKVVAVDADNTLWGGVVGEEGANGIDLLDNGVGEAFRDFQSYLLELRRAGALLALVSKNNDQDVWEAFGRPEMRLRRDHLAAWRVNWEPKSTSIAEIAADLNLGTSAVVFVDDSAHERAQVTTALPDVHALEMPADPARWYEMVAASGELDRLSPTEADLTRAESYQQESERRVLRETASLAQFLEALELQVEIVPLRLADVPRAAQLMAKTNQFTLAGPARPPSELIRCLEDPRYELRMVSATDRFGDYGAIGLFVLDQEPRLSGVDSGSALLDTFLLSCRAMGRGIESAMVAAAFELSGTPPWVMVHDGRRNQPARAFFATLGCAQVETPAPLHQVAWPSHIARITTESRDPAPRAL